MKISSPKTHQEFQQYYHLRWRILRKPWGQKEGSERDETDNSPSRCYHITAVINNKICGVARVEFATEKQFQIRYMAVDDLYRGMGVGRKIIEHIEDYAHHHHANELFLNARENATGFYEKLGYKITEKSYVLFGSIQHFKMLKRL